MTKLQFLLWMSTNLSIISGGTLVLLNIDEKFSMSPTQCLSVKMCESGDTFWGINIYE